MNQDFLEAVKAGDVVQVKELLQSGADVDFLYGMQGTPLCAAISSNQLEVTRCLIEANCDVNAKDFDGEPPLCLAIRKQHSSHIKAILENPSCDVNKKDPVTGDPPVCIAINQHDLDSVKLLIQANCDINIKGSGQTTPLLLAIAHRQTAIMQVLLKEPSCNVNMWNYNGQSPIHTAASLDSHPEVLDTLLTSCRHTHQENGPHSLHLNQQCVMEKSTALHCAIKHQNLKGLRKLLGTGCDVNKTNVYDQHPLFIAAAENNTEMIKLLLQKKANPNVHCKQTRNLPTKNDEWRTSPLHVSISHSNLNAVIDLIDAGADINFQSDKGKTPLMRALDLNKQQITEYLIKVGPTEGLHVDAEDLLGNTALFSACNCAQAGYFAQKLIDLGCRVNHFNHKRETPLCVGVGLNCMDFTSVLLENGAMTEVYHDGCTPLQNAAFENSSGIAALLVYHGANLNSASDTLPPKTALEIAFENESSRVAQLLMICGCNYSEVRNQIRSNIGTNGSWFYSFIANPPKLSLLCRNSIRGHLHKILAHPREIAYLPIPSKLKDFLMLEDILDEFSKEEEDDDSFGSYSVESSDSDQ